MGRVNAPERLAALERALEAGEGVLPEAVAARGRNVLDRAGQRLRLAPERTVVALAGTTGSGKSSLLNALAGEQVAEVDVLRPTTATAAAVLRDGPDAGPLLSWLDVPTRHHVGDGVPLPDGLVLLDLPDIDSVQEAHHWEAARLVELVDLVVWVVDPQKYADGVLHERHLRPLRHHRDVLLVALNQTDRLAAGDVARIVADLRQVLGADGLEGVRVLTTSARTGAGVDELREALTDAVRRREAAVERVVADVVAVAEDVAAACGDASAAVPPGAARETLVDAFADAAGVPVVVEAVRRSATARGRAATGWPVTRWAGRLRPDALRRLHLGGPERAAGRDTEVATTSLAPTAGTGAAGAARAREAVRDLVDTVSAGLPAPWAARVAGAPRTHDLAARLDHAVAQVPLDGATGARRPAWWAAVGALQGVLLLAAVAGGAWLGALAVLAYLGLPQPEPPRWGEVPWPTVGLVGGVLGGWLVAVLARVGVRAGARRRARAARVRLRSAVGVVADDVVLGPVAQAGEALEACRAQALMAAGGAPPRGRSGRGRRE